MSSKGKIFIIILLLFGILFGIDMFSPSVISIDTHPVEMNYGDAPDVSNFTINDSTKIFHIKAKVIPTSDMVEYDTEIIGTQTATFKYKDVEAKFKLTILASQLDTPTIFCNNNIIEWSPVKHADKYIININNFEQETNELKYCLDNIETISGTVEIKVLASSNNIKYCDSEYSNIVTLNRLAHIKYIQYENGKITWDSIEGATKYIVCVNDDKYDVMTNEFEFVNFVNGDNFVTVQACGNYPNISSKIIEQKFVKHSVVTDIQYNISSNKLSWESTNTNCSYQISINDEIYETDLKYHDVVFEFNKVYSIKIKVISKDETHIDSEYSETFEFVAHKLEQVEASLQIGSYSNTLDLEICPLKNADIYTVVVKQFNENNLLITQTYELTNQNPIKEIVIVNNTTNIEVTIVAKDSSGMYADSDELVLAKAI